MYTLSLTEDELLFILVLYGVVDDEVFERYGLDASDTTKERLKKGEESLRTREIVTGESNVPYLSDEATALVGVTVLNIQKIMFLMKNQVFGSDLSMKRACIFSKERLRK
jgi:hypothetical protein